MSKWFFTICGTYVLLMVTVGGIVTAMEPNDFTRFYYKAMDQIWINPSVFIALLVTVFSGLFYLSDKFEITTTSKTVKTYNYR